jgi:hypothetical protein
MLAMSLVLLSLPGGGGVVRRDDGQVVVTRDVGDDRGQPLYGGDDYRPVKTSLDRDRCIVAGPLPNRALGAEVVDDRGTRVAAVIGQGVYAAVLDQPIDGREPPVCCRDRAGEPVPRPLPAGWSRTRVTDAAEPCPACGAVDYDAVLPNDMSRGGRGGHGDDGPMEPCLIVVCHRCGHEDGAGSSLTRFPSAEDEEEETRRAARIARERAEWWAQRWYEDTRTLRSLTFPVYAAERWAARVAGSGSSGAELTNITIGHWIELADDPFATPDFTISTCRIRGGHEPLRHAQRQLESWIVDDEISSCPDEASDAAVKLWFAARARSRRAAALQAVRTEASITVDGSPTGFLRLTASGGRWVAVRRQADLSITIVGHELDPCTLTLEPIADPAARLLGPEPGAPPAP